MPTRTSSDSARVSGAVSGSRQTVCTATGRDASVAVARRTMTASDDVSAGAPERLGRSETEESASPAVAAGPAGPADTGEAGSADRTATEDDDCLTLLELDAVYTQTLADLLAADPLLGDLPASLTPAEVKSLVALEHGTAMAILINRCNKLTRVIVERTATVRDLKMALRSTVELEQERECRRRKLSWRYVWRANWLCFAGRQLKDDNARLSDLGLTNKSEVCFVPRIRAKRGQLAKKGGQLQ